MKEIIEALGRNKDVFHIATWKLTGIEGSFKAFIVSEDFAKLSPDLKEESFNTFRNLDWILKYMEDNIPETE